MIEQDLKPCPFCAGKAKLKTDGITSICCQDCDMSFSNGYRSIIRLKGEWNTRPLEKDWNDAIRASLTAITDHFNSSTPEDFNTNSWTRIYRRLSDLLDQQPPVWRDMESAPKDGRVVMIKYFTSTEVIARWSLSFSLDGGWVQLDASDNKPMQILGTPTGWMPLPGNMT